MNLLGDAHVSTAMVEMLARHGHSCSSAASLPPGLTDIEVYALAAQQNCVILTHDKDFGELVFVHKLRPPGVLLLRIHAATEAERVARVEELLPDIEKLLPGNFVTVTRSRLRWRSLP
jgi:predicted nuclease of predicted toxin-antitoxin system